MFLVIGADYRSTKFNTEELLDYQPNGEIGVYDNEKDAQDAWKDISFRHVDSCNYCVQIIEVLKIHEIAYSVWERMGFKFLTEKR